MPAREAVRITKEATYGTFNGSADAADKAVLHLREGNSNSVRMRPVVWIENSASGQNRPAYQGSEQFEVNGSIVTDLFPSQAGFLVPLACNLGVSGSAGLLDLPSFTEDHKVVLDDFNTVDYRRSLGCKVRRMNVTANNRGSGVVARMSMDVVAKQITTITSGDFAEPTFVSTPGYPTDDPYVFQHMAGKLTIGTSRVGFRDISLTVENTLLTPHDEGPYIRRARWAGRRVMFEATLAYTTLADRTAFEAQTPFAVSFAFDDGVHTLTFDLQGRCKFTNVDPDLPFDGDGYYNKLSMMSLLDLTTGEDLVATLEENP